MLNYRWYRLYFNYVPSNQKHMTSLNSNATSNFLPHMRFGPKGHQHGILVAKQYIGRNANACLAFETVRLEDAEASVGHPETFCD